MAYTTIDNPELYFQTKLYTGTGSSNAITLDGSENMQPDLVWIKQRDISENHMIYDSVRTATKDIRSDGTYAENTNAQSLQSFNSDGFTLGNLDNVNKSSGTFASWNWKAGGTASSNSNGSITSSVSAGITQGMSIVSYTGSGSNATIGHGLGVAPAMIMIKCRSRTEEWLVYHKSLGNTDALSLHLNDAKSTSSTYWQNTTPTSSVFSIGANDKHNKSGETFIAYCFADVKGYSKVSGSYVGNGNSNGSYIHLGFKPAFVMTKRSNNSENWYIIDNKRSPFNPPLNALMANLSHAEDTNATGRIQDFLAQGFKLRTSDTAVNGNGDTYIFMAFASSPFVTSTSVPATAR